MTRMKRTTCLFGTGAQFYKVACERGALEWRCTARSQATMTESTTAVMQSGTTKWRISCSVFVPCIYRRLSSLLRLVFFFLLPPYCILGFDLCRFTDEPE